MKVVTNEFQFASLFSFQERLVYYYILCHHHYQTPPMTFNLFQLSRLIREMDKTRVLSIYHLGTMKTFSSLLIVQRSVSALFSAPLPILPSTTFCRKKTEGASTSCESSETSLTRVVVHYLNRKSFI